MTLFDVLEQFEDALKTVLVHGLPNDRAAALETIAEQTKEALGLAIRDDTALLAAKALRLYALVQAFQKGWRDDVARQVARLARARTFLLAGLSEATGDIRTWIQLELGKTYALRGSLLQHWFDGRSARGTGAALKSFIDAAEAFDAVGFVEDRIRQLVNVGDCAFNLGRLGDYCTFALAEMAYGVALEMAPTWDNTVDVTQWYVKRASVVGELASNMQRQRFEDAIRLFEEALGRADDGADLKTRIVARLNYGGLLLTSRRAAWRDDLLSAIRLLNDARDLAQDLPDLRASADLSLCAAWLTTAGGALTGNIEQALENGEAALLAFQELKEPVDAARASQNLAEAYAMRVRGDRHENYATARFLIRDALKTLSRRRQPSLWAQCQASAGRVEMFHAQPAQSAGWRRAARHMRLARAAAPEYAFSGVEELNLASILVSLHRCTGRKEDFDDGKACANRALAQFAKATDREGERRSMVMLGRYAARSGDWNSAVDWYDRAISLLEEWTDHGIDLSGNEARSMGAGAEVYGLAAFAFARIGQPDTALRRLMAGKARALVRKLDLKLLQSWTIPGLAVVAPVFDDEGSVVLVAGPDGAVDCLDIPGITNEDLNGLLFGSVSGRPAWADHFDTEDSNRLVACVSEALEWLAVHFIERIDDHLVTRFDRDTTRVVLVPYGGSGVLPWHAAGGDRSLSRRWRFQMAPALAQVRGRELEPRLTARNVVAIADPTGSLPNARSECEAVVRLSHGQGIVLGRPELHLETLKQACGAASHIHFAGHAEFDPYDPRIAQLKIGQGRGLTATQIQDEFSLSLRPLVTLAGCETGMADFAERGEEKLGLATAWIAAGASAVIGALWRVPDLATSLLFVGLYDRLFSGQPADEALAGAASDVRTLSRGEAQYRCTVLNLDPSGLEHAVQISNDDVYPFRHPLFWGAFVLIAAPFQTQFDPA